jgi:1,5-anhydro-D-fructose reductase (1,5-anhydro-D-mannitol-forming)
MSGTLGWGVIGIGDIVQGTIAPAMVAEPQCALVAATSRDRGRADAFAARFDVPGAYTDYQEMLADPAVEAVFIATPNALHPEQVIAAAGAGKHVLCDKPLAIDVAGAEAAVEACRAAGVALGINFHNRFLPWVGDVGRLIGEGAIGDVDAVHLEVASGTRHYDNWRADPEMAGLGSVHNVGVHGLDFLRVILGSEPSEVMAMLDPPPATGEVEMLGMLLVRFAGGTLVHVNCNERIAHPRNEITIYGSAGRIVGTGFTRSRVSGHLTITTDRGETVTHYPAPEAHRRSVAAFTAAVLAGEEPSPSGEDGLASARLCAAIDRSAREGRLVEVEGSQR